MQNVPDRLRKVLASDCAHDAEVVLAERRVEDVEALLALLSANASDASLGRELRAKVLHLLGRWGEPAAVAPIRNLLPNLNEFERVSAVDALGRIGTQDALAGILDAADDPSPNVRKFVVLGLGRFNTQEVQSKLNEISAKEPIDYIRHLAAEYASKSRGETP